MQGCIQKFPDSVDNEINNDNEHSLRSNFRVMAANKIAIQLHLVAESCTIWSSRSRRPVQKLLDTASYVLLRDWKSGEVHSLCGIREESFLCK
jgi:hypothetical protein